jgi:hypothetical protein
MKTCLTRGTAVRRTALIDLRYSDARIAIERCDQRCSARRHSIKNEFIPAAASPRRRSLREALINAW